MDKKVKKSSKLSLTTKKKFYDYLILILIAVVIIDGSMLIMREYKAIKVDNETKAVMEAFQNIAEVEGPEIEYQAKDTKINNYKVIGTINIPSVGIKYPILNKTDKDSLNISITKVSGPKLNGYGNVTLAGHNTRNGKMFSRLLNVKLDDIIEITDQNKTTVKYKVYDIFIVMPEDTSATKTVDDSIRELTLFTCVMGGKQRMIVKAKEIIKTDS